MNWAVISRSRRGRVSTVALAALILLVPAAVAGATAGNGNDIQRPRRGIGIYTEYSAVAIPEGQQLSMDLTVANKGRRDENVLLHLERVPRGWKASIRSGELDVEGVPVEAAKSRILTFRAVPGKSVRPGTYTFLLEGVTPDRALRSSQKVVVTVEKHKAAGKLQISTSYPVLRGTNNSSFEFSLDVKNNSDKDRMVNLSAQAPQDWEVSFKPAYASKQISSLQVRAGQSKTVSLDVKPPIDAQAGQYPVVFRASADGVQAESPLKVVLTGTYKLDATTPTGRLSLDATVGKPTTLTLLVRNSGSAVNHDVRLSDLAPENWKIDFKPKIIAVMKPDEIRQVAVTITPSPRALVGDYAVSLTAVGEHFSAKRVDLRVTARAASTWAWVGFGIIAVAICGLGGMFTWLRRR